MLKIKDRIKSLLQHFGYDIVRYCAEYKNPPDLLGILLEKEISSGRRPFVLQVGANDGLRSDPIRDWIVDYRLPGLLIEPLPDMFLKLKQTYQGHDQLSLENCAVSQEDGSCEMYRVSLSADVADWVHGIASFDRHHLQKEAKNDPGILSHIKKVTVRTRTIQSLLDQHGVDHVNVLLVDTEGYDFNVLQMVFDAAVRPDLIQYENCHLSPQKQASAHKLLFDLNYQFVDVGMNTIAIRELGSGSPYSADNTLNNALSST